MSWFPVLLTLGLLTPLTQGVSSKGRAETYYRQGQEAFRKERYEVALKHFEMALLIANLAYGDEALRGDALHQATLAALRARLPKPGVQHAKEFVAWAERSRRPVELARARNDLVEARLADGDLDQAAAALAGAAEAVKQARDRGEAERFEELTAQLAAARAPARPGTFTAAPPPAPHDAGDDDSPESAPSPAPSVPSAPDGESPMVLIPEGAFVMGDAQGKPDERPPHRVIVPAFHLDRHEVTNLAFAAFAAATGYLAEGSWREHAGPGQEHLPVRGVTWRDAEAYARWAGKRLPSEVEWERAARGPGGSRYAFGDDFDPRAARVSLAAAAGPGPVESYPANPFGAFDLTGNVLEWCADWYVPSAYASSAPEPAAESEKRNLRALRGGAWDADADAARNARRIALPPGRALPFVGFRCARDAP